MSSVCVCCLGCACVCVDWDNIDGLRPRACTAIHRLHMGPAVYCVRLTSSRGRSPLLGINHGDPWQPNPAGVIHAASSMTFLSGTQLDLLAWVRLVGSLSWVYTSGLTRKQKHLEEEEWHQKGAKLLFCFWIRQSSCLHVAQRSSVSGCYFSPFEAKHMNAYGVVAHKNTMETKARF